jgi:hypothetical protein
VNSLEKGDVVSLLTHDEEMRENALEKAISSMSSKLSDDEIIARAELFLSFLKGDKKTDNRR